MKNEKLFVYMHFFEFFRTFAMLNALPACRLSTNGAQECSMFNAQCSMK